MVLIGNKWNFEKSELTPEDHQALFSQVRQLAPRVVVSYDISYGLHNEVESAILGLFRSKSNFDISEEDLKEGQKSALYDHNFRNMHVNIYDPQSITPHIRIGQRTITVSHIVGIEESYTRKCGASIELTTGDAILPERYQDIAHKLNMIYTPNNSIKGMDAREEDDIYDEETSLFGSRKEQEGLIPRIQNVYCYNNDCAEKIRNPVLVVETTTVRAYHSLICMEADIEIADILNKDVQFMRREEAAQRWNFKQPTFFRGVQL